MSRFARLVAVFVTAVVFTGCGDSTPTAVPTDPESVEKLKELQRKGAEGER